MDPDPFPAKELDHIRQQAELRHLPEAEAQALQVAAPHRIDYEQDSKAAVERKAHLLPQVQAVVDTATALMAEAAAAVVANQSCQPADPGTQAAQLKVLTAAMEVVDTAVVAVVLVVAVVTGPQGPDRLLLLKDEVLQWAEVCPVVREAVYQEVILALEVLDRRG